MISPDLLELLVCPDSRQRLTQGDAALVAELNRAIAAGKLKNRSGRIVEQALDGLLVREDGELAYPVVDGIPVMLVDQAIAVRAFRAGH